MNSLRFSGSALPETCSAETVVPRITNMSTPASTTVLANSLVRCGLNDPGDGHPRLAHLLEPRGDQLGLDRLGVDLLHPRHRRRSGQAGHLGEQVGRVVVPGPEAFEVEDAEAAVLPERDRGLRGHHRVHRGRHNGQVEPVGVDLPRRRHLFGVARAPARARRRCRRRSTPGGRAWRGRSRSQSRAQSFTLLDGRVAALASYRDRVTDADATGDDDLGVHRQLELARGKRLQQRLRSRGRRPARGRPSGTG